MDDSFHPLLPQERQPVSKKKITANKKKNLRRDTYWCHGILFLTIHIFP